MMIIGVHRVFNWKLIKNERKVFLALPYQKYRKFEYCRQYYSSLIFVLTLTSFKSCFMFRFMQNLDFNEIAA